ncbi:MAG: methylated-DNA--[protein]-cysteine S-methyltransferase [Nitrospinota bacterium]|nr:methylated-DNA--[protein]-cysteine S-methyltransferase [Nitrospinota bacterium]MDH5678206.1 methylated-DNA--[protein]-cysteine S-methyltransferase [Nitrospinota bacterium]
MTETKQIMAVPTRLGQIGLGFAGGKVARLWLPGMSRADLDKAMRSWAPNTGFSKPPQDLAQRLGAYFDGAPVEFDDPVDLSALSAFQQRVLETLRKKVKRGRTVTYSQLAALAGKPGAARAVGSAMAKNPAPLIIPCHRVVRTDGAMGGFSAPGGVEMKRAMLKLEGFYP